jgi:hypothetical protein|tara:strand:- start:7298 stop:7426 length:129 start_codon:yes stop_codon:yes gene_type:complete
MEGATFTLEQRQLRSKKDRAETAGEGIEKLPELDDWLLPNSA